MISVTFTVPIGKQTPTYLVVTALIGSPQVCSPKFLTENRKTAEAITKSYFEAVAMIQKEPKKSFEIMGAAVKQSGEAFEKSQSYLRWQDKASNQKFFAGEIQAFMKEAADLLLETGVIKSIPKLDDIVDASFVK